LGTLAAPRASTTRRCARYVLRRLMIDRTTVSAIAAELGVSWHTVSSIAMRATAGLIAATGPDRLAGVRVTGVDEHRWAPRRRGTEGFVTLIIDLHPCCGEARRCPERNIRADALDVFVFDHIRTANTRPDLLLAGEQAVKLTTPT